MSQRQENSEAPVSTESSHQRGLRLFQEGRYEEAIQALALALQEDESSEVWSDRAVVDLAWGQSKAEQGLRRALALDPANAEAALNLGALLASLNRAAEAIPFLKRAARGASEPQLQAVLQLLNDCRAKVVSRTVAQSQAAFREVVADLQKQSTSGAAPRKSKLPFDGSPRAVAALKSQVEGIKWYHQIELAPGIVTPGCHASREELGLLGLPARLDGRTVLDVGTWDGFFAFEAERRGAQRVLATDGFVWRNRMPGASKSGFDLAHWALHSKVEAREIALAEMSPENVGVFDVVLCEASYDFREPLAAFGRLFQLTGKLLILRSDVDLVSVDRPAVAFYPHVEFAEGASNWWAPNPRAIVEMLKAVAFRDVTVAAQAPPQNTTAARANSCARIIVHAER